MLLLSGLWAPQSAMAHMGTIDTTNKYARSENTGWHNYRPSDGGVTVNDTYLSGYAWAENIGFIKLGNDNGGPYDNTSSSNWGVNHEDSSGNLSGYAWSENVGWINFNPSHSQVTIETGTGEFDGYAWAENAGWIHFKNASPAYNVVVVYPGTTPPTVTGSTPTTDTTPTWSWTTGGDGNGIFRYKLNDSDLESGATETTGTSYTPASALADGSYTLYVQELNHAGNWSYSGSFTIVIDTTTSPESTLVPDVTVTDPIAPIDDLNLPYGSVSIENSLDRKVVVTNDGTEDLTITNTALSNPLSTPFSIIADNCSDKTLPAGGSCSLYVRFSPTAAGGFSDSFDIPSNDPDEGTVTVSVSGTGTESDVPVITVTDSIAHKNDLSAPFGNVTVGSSSDIIVTVANEGSTFLDIGIIGMDNVLSAPFSIVLDNCIEQSLDAMRSCMFTIRFSPTAAGAFSDSFEIPSNDPDESIVTLSVSGTGTTDPVPNISAVPTEISFHVSVGSSSQAQPVTITNVGTGDLSISTLTLTGTEVSEFSIQNDNCSGQTIPGSGECTVEAIFSPASSEEKSAKLTISSDDADTPSAEVSLTGNPSIYAATTESSNATISNYLVMDSYPGYSYNFTPQLGVSFEATDVEDTVDITLTFSSLAINPYIYKIVGDEWIELYPDNDCEGITNITIDTYDNTLSFTIADNSECDGNPATGIVQDPVVVGEEVAAEGGGGGGGFFIVIAGFLLLLGGFCRKYGFRSPAEPQPK